MNIHYIESVAGIHPSQLDGFFDGWPNPPSPATHLQILTGSDYVILAIDSENDRVVGFITAISDGVLCAYIPLLEVLPTYQKSGIGRELTERMLAQLANFYMVDILCDTDVQPFYEQFGMRRATGVFSRNYARQSGE